MVSRSQSSTIRYVLGGLLALLWAVHRQNGDQGMFTVLGVLGGWIVLQLWVLPRLGVPT